MGSGLLFSQVTNANTQNLVKLCGLQGREGTTMVPTCSRTWQCHLCINSFKGMEAKRLQYDGNLLRLTSVEQVQSDGLCHGA